MGTKVKGAIRVTPRANNVIDNSDCVTWNTTALKAGKHFIAFGTPYNLVMDGKGGGSTPKTYRDVEEIAVAESVVSPASTLRFEVSQPAGVELTLAMSMQTFNTPKDVV